VRACMRDCVYVCDVFVRMHQFLQHMINDILLIY